MSKKDYIKLARAIKESKTRDEIIANLSRELKQDNYKFNTERFKNACNG